MFLPENQFLNFPLIFSASAKLPTVDDNFLGIFFSQEVFRKKSAMAIRTRNELSVNFSFLARKCVMSRY